MFSTFYLHQTWLKMHCYISVFYLFKEIYKLWGCICSLLNVFGACIINCKSIGRNLRHRRRRFCSSSISNVIFQGNIETFNLVGIGPRIWKNYVTLSRYIAVVNEGFLSIFFFVKVKASISNYLSIRDRIETWEFVFGRFSLVCFFGWHVLEANVKGTQPHNLHHESRSNSPTTREQQAATASFDSCLLLSYSL